jgi:p-aminobenzoyl-glutamate transporter AbgT
MKRKITTSHPRSTSTITYWIATAVVSFDMAYAAFGYLTHEPKFMSAFASLGYPAYFSTILGVAKFLGVLALLVPGAARLKEWAYAGFTFTFISAICSHLASDQPKAIVMPMVALLFLGISYACRPLQRRVVVEQDIVRPGFEKGLPTA